MSDSLSLRKDVKLSADTRAGRLDGISRVEDGIPSPSAGEATKINNLACAL